MINQIYFILLLAFSGFLTVHGILTLWQTLKGWENPEIADKNDVSEGDVAEKTFFSIIIPARHEKAVIADTLRQLFKQTYSVRKIEILIPMAINDTETITEVYKVINESKVTNVKPVIFNGGPINKPHALNVALNEAKGDYIAIFDAEDQVHPKLLSLVNAAILREGRQIIQTGVSLINWWSNWFNLHAVLEYYFWFNSRLKWYASKGIIPLGGVGVFLPKEVIIKMKGWDEKCLTEDAKLGIDCSIAGFKFKILSDEKLAVQEETPNRLSTFIRQRTRWIQGFLQIVDNRNWENFSTTNQIYFLFLFLFPLFQTFFYIWFMISLFLARELPIALAMLSFLPLFIFAFNVIVQVTGLVEMLYLRKQVFLIPAAVIIYFITFIPYQLLINFCAVRAVIRYSSGNFVWEKTTHFNNHRRSNKLVRLGALNYE